MDRLNTAVSSTTLQKMVVEEPYSFKGLLKEMARTSLLNIVALKTIMQQLREFLKINSNS